ncbi:MAG: methyltransferase domain-containing protein [Candidatus Peribacteria bacterium]|nr:MAG: methyltransferase domain-containing protein [Candidatus Peribacteria bacterium]
MVDEAYDTIIATEVLEHLYNPHLAVSEIQRILKP